MLQLKGICQQYYCNSNNTSELCAQRSTAVQQPCSWLGHLAQEGVHPLG
jgi:hypothetical protein